MQPSIRYVIFTGANERAIIACCRYFRQQKIYFSLITRPGKDKLKLTHFKHHIDAEREFDKLDYDDMNNCVVRLKNKYPNDELHFIPTAESINRVILAHRSMFTYSGLNISLCNERIYSQVSDKESFISLTEKFGIRSPDTLYEPKESDIPFVAKPRKEFSQLTGDKIYPHLILSFADYRDFFARFNSEEYFFQDYIDGESYYYLIDFNDSLNPVVRYQRNLLQQSQGKSVIAAVTCSCPDQFFEQQIISALRSVNYQGLVMVEMMKMGNESWLIEANPRLWGPFLLAVKAGINPISTKRSSDDYNASTSSHSYLWLGGLVANIASGHKPRRYFREGESLTWFLAKSLHQDIYLKKDTLSLFFNEIVTFSMNVFNRKPLKIKGSK